MSGAVWPAAVLMGALVAGAGAVPAVSNAINEAGTGGVRSVGGATITIAGADWATSSTTAKTQLENALGAGMSGAYVSCGGCSAPVNPGGWVCTFFNPTGSGASLVPARTECTSANDMFDILSTATYTLDSWTDDGGNTYTTTTFDIHESKGTAQVLGTMAGVTGPATFPAATESLTEAASGTYPGGSVTVPSLRFDEGQMRAGTVTAIVALLGESWNDRTGIYKGNHAGWLGQIDFFTIVNPTTPINPKGFATYKSTILTEASYTPSSTFHGAPYSGEDDTMSVAFAASPYDISQHEVIQVGITDAAVQSIPPRGGIPDAPSIAFEIWPTPGVVSISAPLPPVAFTEDQVRAGSAQFTLHIAGDEWASIFDWELVRAGLVSDVSTGDEASGFNARKGTLLGTAASVVRVDDSHVRVTLAADSDYDTSTVETLTLTLPGCNTYQKIRVLSAGQSCTPDAVARSLLAPDATLVDVRISPSTGVLSMVPVGTVTECDVRAGFAITLSLANEYWNNANIPTVRQTMYNIIDADLTAAMSPAGFNVHKAAIIRGATSPPPGVTVDATYRNLTITIDPSTVYDLSTTNEVIDLGADILGTASHAATLFRSGSFPTIDTSGAVLTVSPGPCVDLSATSGCVAGTTCGTGFACPDCMVFDELDVRAGAAVITLTLGVGEQWVDPATLSATEVWNVVFTGSTSAVTGWGTDNTGSAPSMAAATQYPNGFLALWDADDGNNPASFVTATYVSAQVLTLTFSDTAYSAGTAETISLALPTTWTASGLGVDPVSFTINFVEPALTISPDPLVLWTCEVQGPAYIYNPAFTGNAGKGWTLRETGKQCSSTDDPLGTGVADEEACAQLCHADATCLFFIYNTGTQECRKENTAGVTCPEGSGFVAAAGVNFYSLDTRTGFTLTLNPSEFVYATMGDVRAGFTPTTSEFFASIATLVPDASIVFSGAGVDNIATVTFAPDVSFLLTQSTEETITFTVADAATRCGCGSMPSAFTFKVKACPGSVSSPADSITEADVWAGGTELVWTIAGDTWKDGITAADVAALYSIAATTVPAGGWTTQAAGCVFKTDPTVAASGAELRIPVGPCPSFDINTDAAGALTGQFVRVDGTVYATVTGALTKSGIAPVGGNLADHGTHGGLHNAETEAKISLDITASIGTMSVDPDTQFDERAVRNGTYKFTVVLAPGETFANPNAYTLTAYVRDGTMSTGGTAVGQGWDYLSTVLVSTAVIDAADPHQLHVTWNANSNYNIYAADAFCVTIGDDLTASGLQALAGDGTTCVKPEPIVPTNGCVSMSPYPVTFTEEEIRTAGFAFTLTLDQEERWAATNLDLLIANMSVASPATPRSTLGFDNRKAIYSASAFAIDATGGELTVRFPGAPSGATVPDPLFDIVEEQRIDFTVPGSLVGGADPTCLLTPSGGPLSFTITPIRGTVSMVHGDYTEAAIRTAGAVPILELVDDTWASPWSTAEKTLLRDGMVSACGFASWPADITAFVAGIAATGGATACSYATGFDGLKARSIAPLVGLSLLQYNNDKLEVPVGPLGDYDIAQDELVVITLHPDVIASRTLPFGHDALWFIIRASTVEIRNDAFTDATGATVTGLQSHGIPEDLIRTGTAPQIRIRLVNESWDPAQSARIAPGFCGAGGDCGNLTAHPLGFNAFRTGFFDTTVTYENDAGAPCPTACPATVAVLTILPQPGFDVCNGATEAVVLSLDPLALESSPGTAPTDVGEYRLGFNITGNPLVGPAINVTVNSPVSPVTEEIIRTGGVTVTLTLFDGRWDSANPSFLTLLQNSIRSNLPASEAFSHAGELRASLLPAALSDLTFADLWGGHAVSFALHDPRYDIASQTPRGCTPSDCYWLQPNLGPDTELVCRDGTTCDYLAAGSACCSGKGGTQQCPRRWPFMCAFANCNGDHCCVDSATACDSQGYGGVRVCDTSCVANETLTVELAPALSKCEVTTPVQFDIAGASWEVTWFSTPATTYEAGGNSQYVGDAFDVLVEGSELYSLNDTAAVALHTDDPCGAGADLYGANITLAPATPTAYPPPMGTVMPTAAGPGLYAVSLTPLNLSVPGVYSVCYRDFRDSGFVAVPTAPPPAAPTTQPLITVVGRAFSFSAAELSGATNVTVLRLDGAATQLRIEGEGLCVGNDTSRGLNETRGYAHEPAGGGCDSVKVMIGDVDCNPGANGLDDGSGRLGAAVGLMPVPGDAPGTPRAAGDAAVELYFRGNHSVCYLSKWSRRWVKLGVVEVRPEVRAWAGCAPNDPDSMTTPEYYSPTHSTVDTPYTTLANGDPRPCDVSGEAWPRKPHRVYFDGVGLTSTGDLLGGRRRQRVYTELGMGVCSPTDTNLGPLPRCFVNETLWGSTLSANDCFALCDATPLCDAVEYDHQALRCGIITRSKHNASGAVYPMFTDPRLYCDANPYINVRPENTLTVVVNPTYPGARCHAATEVDDAADVGDEAKVIMYNDTCSNSTGVPVGALNASTPAVQYVQSDPNGAMWDTEGRACQGPFATANRDCRTTTTAAVWEFLMYGRFKVCYRLLGNESWEEVPGVLTVTAEMVDASPPHRWADASAPTVWQYGRGIEDFGVHVRIREWPVDCNTHVTNPGILGTGWADGVYLPAGVPLDGTLLPDTDAVWLPDPAALLGGFHGVNRTAWEFDEGGVGTPAPAGVADQAAILPRWWTQSGEYAFCAHFPWLLDDGVWGAAHGYVQIAPIVLGFAPMNVTAAPVSAEIALSGVGFDTRAGRDRVKFVPMVLGTCNDHPRPGQNYGDRVIYADQLSPSSDGFGLGSGIRGAARLGAMQLLATAGVYRVCHAYVDTSVYRKGGLPARCSAYTNCQLQFASEPARACCPDASGAFEPCCDQSAALVWREAPPAGANESAPEGRGGCVLMEYSVPKPNDAAPPAWSYSGASTYAQGLAQWYTEFVANGGTCADEAALYSPTAVRRPWDEVLAATAPPCPELYCGTLHVHPLIGAMIVTDHATVEDPPVLEADAMYTLRFDGQGFSVGDYVFAAPGRGADCTAHKPAGMYAVQTRAVTDDPGTPWDGDTGGLPRVMADVALPVTGEHTICMAFQLFPGLYLPAGNVVVVPAVTTMTWAVGQLPWSLDVTFTGAALTAAADAARLVPDGDVVDCENSTEVANTTAFPLVDAAGGTLWKVDPAALEYGLYYTCYQISGVGWVLLDGAIRFPFANVPPGFELAPDEPQWGPVDNLVVYGPRGQQFEAEVAFAVQLSKAVDANGERLDWVPPEARQNLTFEISSVTGDAAMFKGACHSAQAACYSYTILTAASCAAAGCVWNSSATRCNPLDVSTCAGRDDSSTACEAAGCVWAAGGDPVVSIDGESGMLRFAAGDIMRAGDGGAEVVVTVLLRDTGGTLWGGSDASVPQPLRVTFLRGPRMVPVDPRIVTLVEDRPADGYPLIVNATARPSLEFVAFLEEEGMKEKYFAGGLAVTPSGGLQAFPSPDRWVEQPGLPLRVALVDAAVGAATVADFNVSIIAVNDPPYIDYAAKYRAAPEVWAAPGAAPFTARVLDVPTSPWGLGIPCRTNEFAHCARVHLARGCPAAVQEVIGYDCVARTPCLNAVCNAPSTTSSVAGAAVGACRSLSPADRRCAEEEAAASGCSAEGPSTACAVPAAACLRAICAAVPPTTLSFGPYEPDEGVLEITATVPAVDRGSFAALPTVSAEGILTFTLSSGTGESTIPISITITDTGGEQFAYGGKPTYALPTPLIVRTFTLPELLVAPASGGTELETTWEFTAQRHASDESGIAWTYSFTTILHTDDQVTNVRDEEKRTIGHSLYGPDGTGVALTQALPSGRHTVVMKVYEDDVLAGEVRRRVDVAPAPPSTVAAALQANALLAAEGNGGAALPMLAGAADAMRGVDGAGGAVDMAATAVLQAVDALRERRTQPNEGLDEDTVYTALAALRSLSEGRTVAADSLLRLTEAYESIRSIPSAEPVSAEGYLTLSGVAPAVMPTQQGTGLHLAPSVVAALQRDVAASLGVAVTAVQVEPLVDVPHGRPDRVGIAYTVDGMDAAALAGAVLQVTETSGSVAALQRNLPAAAVDYPTSFATSTAVAQVQFPGLDLSNPALLAPYDVATVADALLDDFAASVGAAREAVVGQLMPTTDGTSAVLQVTVNTDNAPQLSASVRCAMTLACTASSVAFPSAPAFPPDLAGSTLDYTAAGEVQVVGVDYSQLAGGGLEALQAALVKDLNRIYGVPVDVTVVAARGGQVVARHRVPSFAAAADAAVQHQALEGLLAAQAVTLPAAREVLGVLPPRAVAVDTAVSAPSNGVHPMALTEVMVSHFLRTSASVLAAAPRGPSVWQSPADADAAAANATARDNYNFAVAQQLGAQHAVLEAHCNAVLLPAARAAQTDTQPIIFDTPTFTAHWRALLKPPAPANAVPLNADLAAGSGLVGVVGGRPDRDTCFVIVVYSRPPYLAEGRPGVTPLAPVVAVAGPSPSVTVTFPVATGAGVAAVYWDEPARQWGPVGTRGTMVANTAATRSVTLTAPAGGVNAAPPLPLGLQLIGVALEAEAHSGGFCLPCVVLPVLLVPWLCLVVLSACLVKRVGREAHHRARPVPKTDAEKVEFAVLRTREPTYRAAVLKHHAFFACGIWRPSLINFYTRGERATVLFSVYFVAIGVLSLFYDRHAVLPWGAPPDVDVGECVAIALLTLLVAWLPSLALRWLLSVRERCWLSHVRAAGIDLPAELEVHQSAVHGPSAPPALRWGLYFLVAGACTALCIVHYMWTIDYNTGAQVERWLLAFFVLLLAHFLVEFAWAFVMLRVERRTWDSKKHPRHALDAYAESEAPLIIRADDDSIKPVDTPGLSTASAPEVTPPGQKETPPPAWQSMAVAPLPVNTLDAFDYNGRPQPAHMTPSTHASTPQNSWYKASPQLSRGAAPSPPPPMRPQTSAEVDWQRVQSVQERSFTDDGGVASANAWGAPVNPVAPPQVGFGPYRPRHGSAGPGRGRGKPGNSFDLSASDGQHLRRVSSGRYVNPDATQRPLRPGSSVHL